MDSPHKLTYPDQRNTSPNHKGQFSVRSLGSSPNTAPRSSVEEEEGLYLRIEPRKRVQTNEAKSKRRRASPTKTTGRRDNTPASRCLPSRRVLLARKGYRQPITPQGLQGWRAHPKRWPCQGHQPQQWCERTRHPCWRGMEHAWDPQGCADRPAKKIEGVEPHPIIPSSLCGGFYSESRTHQRFF